MTIIALTILLSLFKSTSFAEVVTCKVGDISNGHWEEVPGSGCLSGNATITGQWSNIYVFTTINGRSKQVQRTNFPGYYLPLEILHVYDCSWVGGPQSQYQEECNAWAQSKCPSPEELASFGNGCIDAPYCHSDIVPQIHADPYISNGYCFWNIPGKLGCQGLARCVTSNKYYKWVCNTQPSQAIEEKNNLGPSCP